MHSGLYSRLQSTVLSQCYLVLNIDLVTFNGLK